MKLENGFSEIRSLQCSIIGKDLTKYRYNDLAREKIRKQYNINNQIVFGHVGNLNEQKNHEFLIDVFYEYHKNNPESLLFIIGRGFKRQLLEKIVKEYEIDDSVIFTGSIENVNEYLQAMDIMMLPSFYEGLPNVVLEWQAAGLPCIVSNTVTKECKVYEYVYFQSIYNGTDEWVKLIEKIISKKIDRNEISKIGCLELKKNGFEIIESTKNLEKKYMELMKR